MVTRSDLYAARERLSPHILSTPVVFDDRLGVWIKWENHQHTKSFKVRGAFNKMMALSADELGRGLIAASAGNHGQGEIGHTPAPVGGAINGRIVHNDRRAVFRQFHVEFDGIRAERGGQREGGQGVFGGGG